MKYTLFERVPRKHKATSCEIVCGNGEETIFSAYERKKRKREALPFVSGSKIELEKNIYSCFQKDGSYALCYFDKKKAQISLICKKCLRHFMVQQNIFFQKKDIWYAFDTKRYRYQRLGTLHGSLWRTPKTFIKGVGKPVDVYYFFKGQFLFERYDKVIKMYGCNAYFLRKEGKIDVAMDFYEENGVPKVGSYYRDLSPYQLWQIFPISQIPKKIL